ncbi:MAG: tyrosine-type recombinase/integrase, partial [Myxococcales bacterium]|nr:tyrosine-type recombinase/integrase [Myxococcales bacterium]
LSASFTMNDLAGRFRRYVADERKLSANTVATYCGVARAFLTQLHEELGPEVPIQAVAAADVRRFLQLRSPGGERAAKAGWNLQLCALRSLFAYLEREGIMDCNPADEVDRVKVRSSPPHPPTLDDVLALIDAIEERSPEPYRLRNVLIVQLLFHCSLRVSELVSLDVDQVVLDPNDVAGYRLLGVRRKGDKRQHIVFNDVVAEAIESYLDARARFAAPEGEPALLLSDRRRRLSASAVRRIVRRYAELAGIRSSTRSVSPHSLRHASATEMERLGARPRVIQEHLGHASIQTTQRYLHAAEDEQRGAVDGVGERFRTRQAARVDEAKKGAA